MAEIEIIIPTVQYGNVRVTATPEELGIKELDPYATGYWAAIFLNLATQGFKKGASEDLGGPKPAPAEPSAAQAAALLNEGLGGVTELPEGEYDSATEAKEAAQARTADAPWDNPAVDTPKKPWETETW